MKRLQLTLLLLPLLASPLVHAEPGRPSAAGKSQVIIRAGSQPSIKGSADIFSGNVRVDPLFPAGDAAAFSGATVNFDAGARSAWHTHPAGQYLLITQGTGWTQQWGGQVTEIHAGDVVWCPPGVKHWHGATPASAMSHIALTGTLDGKNVEWLEKISDQQYRQ